MSNFRERIYEVIFEAETPAGRSFDLWLIGFVLISVIVVMLESVRSLGTRFATEFFVLEWFFTIAFTIEFVLRLYAAKKPLKYFFSFFGLVDFLSILPTYLSLMFPGFQSLNIIRGLRVLRIFRILKLSRYTNASRTLSLAMRQSLPKITVFLGSILTLLLIIGAIMYLIEGKENGFTSIPLSVYWAIVTVTTVGYGDISPQTPLGQFVASILMILGYAILAVPTGIVSVELANVKQTHFTRTCKSCTKEAHDEAAKYCSECGEPLEFHV